MKKILISLLIWINNNTKYRKVNKGKNVRIGSSTKVMNSNNISIGKNSSINSGMIMAGKNSKIIIGENCLLSYNVHIRTKTHKYENKNKLILEQGEYEKDIIIGNDVWIGYGAQIMPGVKLGDGCVVGAGAVVTKDVEPYKVVGGVPARIIRERKDFKE